MPNQGKQYISVQTHPQRLRKELPPLPESLAKDFRVFLCVVWAHLNLPRPTPMQLDMANYLQLGVSRRVLEAFRGFGKSWIASAYVVWRLRINPFLKFLVVSASKDRADNFTTFTLRLIMDMPILHCLIPDNAQRCSKLSFDVAPALADHAPSVTSKGITSQLAGARADEVISDDVEVPYNSATQSQRDKVSEDVKEYDAIIKPGGIITFLGTPHTEDSLYNRLVPRGYAMRIWPARFPTKEEVAAYNDNLAPAIVKALEKNPALVGLPTDPTRYSREDLAARELSYGKAGFALQFMLNTALSDIDKQPLKLRDLIITDIAPDEAPEKFVWCSSEEKEIKDLPCVGLRGDRYYSPMKTSDSWKPYTGATMTIDPSGRGADETGYAVVKMLNGFLFLTAAGGHRGGYEKATLEGLAATAVEQKVNKIIVESNFGDGMFTELLKPYLNKAGWRGQIVGKRSTMQKERRICDTLEPVIAQHRLVVDKALIQKDFDSVKTYPGETAQQYQLFYQLTRITRDRNSLGKDDRLDAVALAVADWVELMSLDADLEIKKNQEELFAQELELWVGENTQPLIDLSCMVGAGIIDTNLRTQGIYQQNNLQGFFEENSRFSSLP